MRAQAWRALGWYVLPENTCKCTRKSLRYLWWRSGGIIERCGSTLYSTVVHVSPSGAPTFTRKSKPSPQAVSRELVPPACVFGRSLVRMLTGTFNCREQQRATRRHRSAWGAACLPCWGRQPTTRATSVGTAVSTTRTACAMAPAVFGVTRGCGFRQYSSHFDYSERLCTSMHRPWRGSPERSACELRCCT